jgi:acyl carrier protein
MNEQGIRAGIIETLAGIAPEIDAGELIAAKPLRNQVDLDSMDWLNVIIGLHQRFAVDIPEADYAQLTSLDAIVAYLAARLR